VLLEAALEPWFVFLHPKANPAAAASRTVRLPVIDRIPLLCQTFLRFVKHARPPTRISFMHTTNHQPILMPDLPRVSFLPHALSHHTFHAMDATSPMHPLDRVSEK
jgi:hypothetical protein